MNSDEYLAQKFPDMQLLSKAPMLASLNGIGTTVYGRRDHDVETESYVTTLCFCLVFVPIFMLGGYRVVDGPQGGWIFLGKVPLSPLARFWNWAVAFALVASIGGVYWHVHTSDPAYAAGRKMAAAEDRIAAGQVGEGAELLGSVAQGNTSQATPALRRVQTLLDQPDLDAKERARVYAVAVELHRTGRPTDTLAERGLAWAKQSMADDPRTALQYADQLRLLVAEAPDKNPVAREIAELRLQTLEKVSSIQPDDMKILSEVALAYEGRKDLARCEQLLAPHAAKLGDLEGARILGQIYAQQNKFEAAYPLLSRYAEERLPRLHKAENDFQSAVKQVNTSTINLLKSGVAPGFDYRAYKTRSNAEQDQMVNEFLDNALRQNAEVRRTQEEIRASAPVVPVALDLGMILLQRGQAAQDPAERKTELERAEKTLLAVGGVAGQSDEFRINLGQVYYWLGKHAEGKKLFDDLLEAQKRKPEMLLAVSRLLRNVGAQSEARALAEEAYEKNADPQIRYQAAAQREVLSTTLEDRIVWLKRGNPSDRENKASLLGALADEAASKGRDDEAMRDYRQAIAVYAELPESAATLNNGALLHFSLFRLTGDSATLDKGIAMLDRAITLKPGDSILIGNVADSVMSAALADIVGKQIDLRTLKSSGSFALLSCLYDDAAGRDEYRKKVRAHAGVRKARSYYERQLLLAPKSARAYRTLTKLHTFLDDAPALADLVRRLKDNPLDLADAVRRQREWLEGKEDDKLRADFEAYAPRAREEFQHGMKVGGATAAAALEAWETQQVARDAVGLPLSTKDIDDLIDASERLHKSSPSTSTRTTLMGVLLLRAHHQLRAKEPAYEAYVAKCHRLGATMLIGCALSEAGPLSSVCGKNADVQRVLALLRESVAKFPRDGSAWTWAMFRHTDPEVATRLVKILDQDEVHRLQRAIDSKTNAVDLAGTFDRIWTLQMHHQDAQAEAVRAEAIKAGLPVPVK